MARPGNTEEIGLAPDPYASIPSKRSAPKREQEQRSAPVRATRKFDPAEYGLRTDVQRNTTDDVDAFFVPPELIPQGWVVQWHNLTIMGMPERPETTIRHLENGWQVAPAKLFQKMLPPGYSDDKIVRGGQILMMRPKHLTDQALAEERAKAINVRRTQERKLSMTPTDTFERVQGSVKTSYERMEIPDDDEGDSIATA